MKLNDIPSHLGMKVLRDGHFEHLGKAQHIKQKMLVFVENDTYLRVAVANPSVTAVLTTSQLAGDVPEHLAVAVSASPREAFYVLHDYLRLHTSFYGHNQPSKVAPDTRLHPSAFISEVGVVIGPGCTVEAGALVLTGTRMERDVVIRSGATIGAEGFEFRNTSEGLRGIPHAGGIILRERVEIQNNTVVERAPYGGFTLIGEDTKIGGAALVAHNCQIGCRCMVAGGVTISGNVTIGNDVWIGPGSTISNGLTIGNRAHITIGSVVARNVPEGTSVTGNFAIDHQTFLRHMSRLIAHQSG